MAISNMTTVQGSPLGFRVLMFYRESQGLAALKKKKTFTGNVQTFKGNVQGSDEPGGLATHTCPFSGCSECRCCAECQQQGG